jgi:hypothetical protein
MICPECLGEKKVPNPLHGTTASAWANAWSLFCRSSGSVMPTVSWLMMPDGCPLDLLGYGNPTIDGVWWKLNVGAEVGGILFRYSVDRRPSDWTFRKGVCEQTFLACPSVRDAMRLAQLQAATWLKDYAVALEAPAAN